MLAYQTAYLKANYPLEFMTALLATVMENHDKMAEYIEEAKRMNLPVLPPDIQKSQLTFTMEGRAIRFGLLAVKNVGAAAIRNIIEAREDGPFKDLLDLCRRVDLRICNRRVLESLIECGAMDSFPGHRAQNLSVLDDVMEQALLEKQLADKDQLSFAFSGSNGEDIQFHLSQSRVTPYSREEKLEKGKRAFGIVFVGPPVGRLSRRDPKNHHPYDSGIKGPAEQKPGLDCRTSHQIESYSNQKRGTHGLYDACRPARRSGNDLVSQSFLPIPG